RLVQALGRPAWALEPQLATTAGRLAAVDALEARLEEWTGFQRASPPAARLPAGRLEAGPVARLPGPHGDPQIAHPGHFGHVHHPVLGTHPAERHAIRFSDMEPRLRAPAPRLGEHTDAVLHDLLAMSTDEIGRLRDAGVLD